MEEFLSHLLLVDERSGEYVGKIQTNTSNNSDHNDKNELFDVDEIVDNIINKLFDCNEEFVW